MLILDLKRNSSVYLTDVSGQYFSAKWAIRKKKTFCGFAEINNHLDTILLFRWTFHRNDINRANCGLNYVDSDIIAKLVIVMLKLFALNHNICFFTTLLC